MKINKAIEGFIIYLKASGYSQSTIDLYSYVLNILTDYLRNPDLEKIKNNDLSRYFVYLREEYVPSRKNGDISPLSGSTLQNHWKAIRTFFKWAEEEINIKKRPDIKLKLPPNNPRVINPFSEDDIQKLIKAAVYSEYSPKNRKPYIAKRRTAKRDLAIILTLLDTGLRIGELCRLNINDVDLETGEVFVEPYGNSNKKTHSRIVHLGRTTRRTLWLYLANREGNDAREALFVSQDNLHRITPNSIRLILKELGNKSGVKDCHPHRFRHTFCIEFLRNSGDIFHLQAITGHTSTEILKNYLKIANTDTARVHQRASPVDNWNL